MTLEREGWSEFTRYTTSGLVIFLSTRGPRPERQPFDLHSTPLEYTRHYTTQDGSLLPSKVLSQHGSALEAKGQVNLSRSD